MEDFGKPVYQLQIHEGMREMPFFYHFHKTVMANAKNLIVELMCLVIFLFAENIKNVNNI